MNKILPIIIAFFLTLPASYAVQDVYTQIYDENEVVLEIPSTTPYSISVKDTDSKQNEKTLKEKLADIYHLEVEQIDKPHFLLKDVL